MPTLSDYELEQIKKSIQNINTKTSDIKRTLSRNRYSSDISKARDTLRSYSNAENTGLKNAEKTINKAMNGSGFFSNGGFNKAIENKANDSYKEVGRVIGDYFKEIDALIEALPQIGIKGKTTYSFEASEYEGDKDYSTDNFTANSDFSSGGFAISFGAIDQYEHTSRDNGDAARSEPEQQFEYSKTSYSEELVTDRNTTVIGIGSISNPNLKRVILTCVKEIQANVFRGCDNLELLVINKDVQSIDINAFRGLKDTCILAFESDKTVALSKFSDVSCLNGRQIIFGYLSGDEKRNKASSFQIEQKADAKPAKKTIIRKDTPLDNNEIKALFLERNSKYSLNMDELNTGIANAGTNVDKDLIIYYALLARRKRALNEGSYWDYASALGYALKAGNGKVPQDERLAIICGLLFLDSSGYRMVNGKYNPYMQEPDQMCYHPKMELGDLFEIVSANGLTNEQLAAGYKQSPFVAELQSSMKKPYYTVDDSIKLMHMALKNPDYPFYPAQSGIIRKN